MDYKNQEVPTETYVRCLLRRNKQLELEVSKLKAELDAKKAAIAAFKKWQSKVVQYKLEYWTNEALAFLGENAPAKRKMRKLKDVLKSQRCLTAETNKLVDHILVCQEKYDEETFKEIKGILDSLKEKEEEGA